MSDAAPQVSDEPVHVESAEQFEEFTGRDGVVIADFYADWCGPCKMLEPTLASIAAETDATVVKVDVDAHQELAATFGVQGVPNLVFFRDGDPKKRVVGVQGQAALESVVASLSD
ncbi:thioredoxin [Salinigranum marinum]|uniref:thioredoxin n=1 Tax=Salinigranum marinum TaxID=1515595 RepID=UPI002989D416|nr:thioredoxin [Salinigranum marinum]